MIVGIACAIFPMEARIKNAIVVGVLFLAFICFLKLLFGPLTL